MNKILNGDCLEMLKTLEDNSIDSIVTDPPYGLEFMGKDWDSPWKGQASPEFNTSCDGKLGGFKSLPNHSRVNNVQCRICNKWKFSGSPCICDNPDFPNARLMAMQQFQDWNLLWAKECLRVLKPGGHLLAFSGTRTYHRMAVAIEDAGFEVRDMIEWVYGSGFPKSLNISKMLDKKPKADSVKDWKKWLDIQISNCEKSKQQINDECGFTATSYVKTDNKDYWSSNLPKNGKWQIMKKVIGITTDEYDWVEQDNCEQRGYVEPTGGLAGGSGNTVGCFTGKQLSNNAIDERAKQYEGWGTALKPAHEPICMARKPLSEKTVAENCLKYGTCGINIDESRVEIKPGDEPHGGYGDEVIGFGPFDNKGGVKWKESPTAHLGRFPANICHDNSEEVRECFPETKQPSFRNGDRVSNNNGIVPWNKGRETGREVRGAGFTDTGNASRFFRAIPQVVDLNDFSMYNRSIIINIKKLCGQHLTKKKTGIILDGVIQEVEKFIQDAELLISGNSTMEKFLTDIAFTIKILIAQMTELKTLNVLPNWLITKFTENYEQTIKLLKELNTEDVRSAKSIFLLKTFINEVLESIRDIAENVVKKDSNNGEKVSDSFFKSILYYPKASKSERNKGCEGLEEKQKAGAEFRPNHQEKANNGETGNPFGRWNKVVNNHPTVKPIALMEYLIKMVTPKGGVVLDPFAGSFSTGVACVKNGFGFIGIEREEEYVIIGKARMEQAQKEISNQLDLFQNQ